MCDVTASCACREAVIRAYGQLKDRKVPNRAAFDSAVTVFRFHHPEISAMDAKYTVAGWVGDGE